MCKDRWIRCTLLASLLATRPSLAGSNKAEITLLHDAFGRSSTMKKDWGFSAFIEYGGKRISCH